MKCLLNLPPKGCRSGIVFRPARKVRATTAGYLQRRRSRAGTPGQVIDGIGIACICPPIREMVPWNVYPHEPGVPLAHSKTHVIIAKDKPMPSVGPDKPRIRKLFVLNRKLKTLRSICIASDISLEHMAA